MILEIVGRWVVHLWIAVSLICSALVLASARPVFAQQTNSLEPLPTSATNTTLDNNPLGTSRGAGMSQSLTAVADDLDALLFNPAGIGGMHDQKNPPLVRKLYFPQISLFANKNTRQLQNDFSTQNGAADSTIGSAIIDAHSGKRQYGRISSALGLVFGRLIIIPFNDIQIASVSQGEGTDLVDMRYRNQSGVGYGFSIKNNSGKVSLGYSGYMMQRSEIYGSFLYDDIADVAERKRILKENKSTSSGQAHNAGLSWLIGKAAAPTLHVVMHDIGGTKFKAKGGAEGAEDTLYKPSLTTGFSLATPQGKPTSLTWMLEATRISDDDTAFNKKLRTSFEWSIAGNGTYALAALRGGYSFAGPSVGASVNLGIIGFDAGFYSVDIGTGNEKLTEQRYTGTVFVNVAEY